MKIKIKTNSETMDREFTLKIGAKVPYEIKWLYEMGATISGITVIHDTKEIKEDAGPKVINFEKKK